MTDAARHLEIPPLGYPIGEKSVSQWFQDRHRRAPTDQEVGTIMAAMAEREASSPRTGKSPAPEGWTDGAAAPPAPRR